MSKKSIIIGITGASGSIYAYEIINILSEHLDKYEVSVIATNTARSVWKDEMGEDISIYFDTLTSLGITIIENDNFYTPYASGSSAADTLILLPCSAGMAGRIASGVSNDLLSRIADVQLKERKQLLIAIRESPLNLIQLRNLTTLSEAGAIISPVSPVFYKKPTDIKTLTESFAKRVLATCGYYELENTEKWTK